LRQDLEKFENGDDVSVGIQGSIITAFLEYSIYVERQISVGLTSLKRTIDDYDSLAKREMILVKQEKALLHSTSQEA
ncbi:295_t:CDS:2, partial [Racocetra fulgida]